MVAPITGSACEFDCPTAIPQAYYLPYFAKSVETHTRRLDLSQTVLFRYLATLLVTLSIQ